MSPVRGGEAHVDCGACRACCHQIVILLDDEEGYDVESVPTPRGEIVRVLRRNPDGSCIYLSAGGCSVYADRPAVCRIFDCGRWYQEAPRALKKAMMRAGGQEKRMLKAGRRRAQGPAKLPAFAKATQDRLA